MVTLIHSRRLNLSIINTKKAKAHHSQTAKNNDNKKEKTNTFHSRMHDMILMSSPRDQKIMQWENAERKKKKNSKKLAMKNHIFNRTSLQK